jgi:uncharacterized protein YwgA
MDGRLVVLSRVAEALGEDGSIASFDARKRFQKAIYLGQVAGVDLGYRYGWYIKGPYSTELTRDYYAMAEAVAGGEQIPGNQQLRDDIRVKLRRVRAQFEVPEEVSLSKADWMELLASWHYLLKVTRLDVEKARRMVQDRKAHLFPFIPRANETLTAFGLL